MFGVGQDGGEERVELLGDEGGVVLFGGLVRLVYWSCVGGGDRLDLDFGCWSDHSDRLDLKEIGACAYEIGRVGREGERVGGADEGEDGQGGGAKGGGEVRGAEGEEERGDEGRAWRVRGAKDQSRRRLALLHQG